MSQYDLLGCRPVRGLGCCMAFLRDTFNAGILKLQYGECGFPVEAMAGGAKQCEDSCVGVQSVRGIVV